MRTACALTIRGIVCPVGVSAGEGGVCPVGVSAREGGVCPGGCVSAKGGVPCDLSHHAFDVTCMLSQHQVSVNTNAAAYIQVHAGIHHPLWTEWQTGVKNITFPQLRLPAVIKLTPYPKEVAYILARRMAFTLAGRAAMILSLTHLININESGANFTSRQYWRLLPSSTVG